MVPIFFGSPDRFAHGKVQSQKTRPNKLGRGTRFIVDLNLFLSSISGPQVQRNRVRGTVHEGTWWSPVLTDSPVATVNSRRAHPFAKSAKGLIG